jgi:hypothetical protein
MEQLEGFPLFSTAVAVILDEMEECGRTSFTWEEVMISQCYAHWLEFGVQPVWVKGWARVARYMIGQEDSPFRKNGWRIRKDAANRARLVEKYGPRKRTCEFDY